MGKVIKKLRELNDEELDQQYMQSKKDLLDQRFEAITGHVTNVKQVNNIKKKVARIMTLKRERELKEKK